MEKFRRRMSKDNQEKLRAAQRAKFRRGETAKAGPKKRIKRGPMADRYK